MKKITSRIWGKCLRTIYAVTGMRPTSYPYISGDGFRALARHIHEKGASFDPKDVSAGDIVFVESALLRPYFTLIHPQIKHPYVLITHNGDENIGPEEAGLADDKIIRWFAQNVLTAHPKIMPIPIGLENAHFAGAGRPAIIRNASKNVPEKNGRVLVAFTAHTNPKARGKALAELRLNPLADICEKRMSQREYLETLKTYSFVASPPGNGEDCHRTWEALCVKTRPIVQASVCMEYFKNIGVPLVIQDSWLDTQEGTDDPFPAPDQETSPIFFTYWKRIILDCVRTHEHD